MLQNVTYETGSSQYCQMQLVTDYICGMTDSFARDLHQKLKNG